MNILHSENFDLCRICLSEPESNRHMQFLHILGTVEGNFDLKQQFEELIGIQIESNDNKPKIVCDNCYKAIFAWYEMKKKAKESEIVINYIATKRFGVNNPGTSKASNSSATLRDRKSIKNDVNLNASTSRASTSRASTSRASTSMAITSRASTSRASTSRDNTSIASTSRASTSRASTSRASTSRDNTSIASTSRASTRRANTSMASTSRASTSMASTSRASTSRASTSRSYYNHGHSSRTILTTISNVESVVEESNDDCIEIQNSVNTVESENYSGHEIEESKLDINYTDIELLSTTSHESIVFSIKNEDLSEDESDDNSFFPEAKHLPQTSRYINNQNGNENKKLYYCNICQKDNVLDHNCFEYNKNFSTCLVPNCNILSRSIDDFMPHYQLHIGMSSSAVMCKRCYQEIEKSDFSANGCHVQCRKVNPFKCYTCNIIFNNMAEFAFHKLKKHNGRLMDSEGNYLCLYCEEYSTELPDVIGHIKNCLEGQSKNVPHTIRIQLPAIGETYSIAKNTQKKNAPVQSKKNKKNFSYTPKMSLFTCLKPSCNLIYQSSTAFKNHHRQHSGIKTGYLMCWQCCNGFKDLNGLRLHQARDNCPTPGIFKCDKCPENFDDIESLSVHKYTLHNGKFIAAVRKKIIKCPFCKLETKVKGFKSHLIACEKKIKSIKTTNCTTNNLEDAYKCGICDKTFGAAVSLSNHLRVHKPRAYRKSVM
ncbi:LOW QUALITY PROTEIN: zinc finger protein 271-like [Aphis gossypii]|uniref:LOW QUALITY PROTEIN: zinc finger protein 271-like n=1 Tax=Aphis gossypii TaxID=80765 RepID=UPI002159A9F6|nr:LOW QUALITY PROTEIN: zinc finger protein 271-like [Aphis gossypii]